MKKWMKTNCTSEKRSQWISSFKFWDKDREKPVDTYLHFRYKIRIKSEQRTTADQSQCHVGGMSVPCTVYQTLACLSPPTYCERCISKIPCIPSKFLTGTTITPPPFPFYVYRLLLVSLDCLARIAVRGGMMYRMSCCTPTLHHLEPRNYLG
jgi:hypothetical protein